MIKNYVYLNPGLTIDFNGEKYYSENGLKDLLEDLVNETDDSTITFLFLVAVLAIVKDYLVAFFLLATVLRFPLRVRELFLVRCPLKGSPAL